MRAHRLVGWSVAATAIALLLASCQPTGTTPLRITYDEGSPRFSNHGAAALSVVVVSADGGAVSSASSRTAYDGRAVRFPLFDPTLPAPRALVKITNAGATDHLDPGSGRFQFGTDFTLDAASADLSPASVDDGDNLVQRGRYDDVTQYKLEIDRRQPICRVKGRSGEVTIVAGVQVEANRWYRAACIRNGNSVTVSVSWWSSGGSVTTRSWSRWGPTGDMRPLAASVPVSLGGKLQGSAVDGDADQFNGRLDNTYLTIG